MNGEFIVDFNNPMFNDPSVMIAYVDGSYNKSTKEYGSGCLIIHNGTTEELTATGKDPLKATMRNVSGEIDASMTAMEKATSTEGVTTLHIYYDYKGVEMWCTGKWKTNKLWTMMYKKFYDKVCKNLNIKFHKVEAHSNDVFNDRADYLAKKACGLLEE